MSKKSYCIFCILVHCGMALCSIHQTPQEQNIIQTVHVTNLQTKASSFNNQDSNDIQSMGTDYNDDNSADNQKMINSLIAQFKCPTFLMEPPCNQESVRVWATKCLKAGTPNFRRARLAHGLASLGEICNVRGTCHWPECNFDDRIRQVQHGTRDLTATSFQDKVLNNVKRVLGNVQCTQSFNAQKLAEEISNDGYKVGEFEAMATATIQHLLEGECIESDSTTNIYLDALFEKYALGEAEVNEEGLEQLLVDVNLDVGSDTNDTDSSLSRTNLETSITENNTSNIDDCLSNTQLLKAFDKDNSLTLNKTEFLESLAYIVYQISSGSQCSQKNNDDSGSTSAEAYAYGTLCVFVISACSALGFLIIPMLSESVYETMMAGFIALAFGTLTGDALLHMLPDCLMEEDDSVKVPDSFWKCFVIMLSIYGLFLFESLTMILSGGHSHGHSHGNVSEGAEASHGHSHMHSHELIHEQMKQSKVGEEKSDDLKLEVSTEGNNQNKEGNDEKANLLKEMLTETQTPVFLGLTSLALVIIIGDAIHNVTDGLAIGAAFSSGVSEGFSTALAVFFHELPHEFGDFVILLMTGLSLKRALCWNFISSLSSFIGLYIGIPIGENDVADQWIFAVTTGMFLYVALADMLPELRNMKVKKQWLAFVAQNVGTLFGMGFMVFMYFLEDLIHF